MRHKRLFELAAYTLAVAFAVVVPLCWRLRHMYVAFGRDAVKDEPLTLWLPIDLFAALATYVLVLASLVPQRFFFSISVLLIGMTAMLLVVYGIFGDVGHIVNQLISPFVVHLVTLGIVLACARLLRFRICRVNQLPKASGWQYPIADLLMLTTALALFLSMVHQFDFFWYHGGGLYQEFIWLFGFSLFISSLATVWAVLSKHWMQWAVVAIALAPVGLLPGWYARSTLLFEFYWYVFPTVLHSGFLMSALLLLRVNGYELVKVPRLENNHEN